MRDIEDGEIGRGRQNDSSSSRESSPQRPRIRSFSPNSDDGDLIVPPIAFDDTPPPPERPILRQPVAFAWPTSMSVATVPTALETYKVSMPTAPISSSIHFLPGQEVPPPPRPPKKNSSSSGLKKSDRPSKKRRPNEYSAQTGRFRLQTYDPSPSLEPPIDHGSGPYSSMYRGTSGYSPHMAPSPVPTLTSHYSGDGGSTAFQTPAPESSVGQIRQKSATKRPKQTSSRPKPTTARRKVPNPRTMTETGTAASSAGGPLRSVKDPSHGSSSNRNSVGGHYRRDYERDTTNHGSGSMYPSMLPAQAPDLELIPNPTHPNLSSGNDTLLGGNKENAPNVSKKPPLRMVTLLIQDIRSGVTDHQLAEVKIPIKATDDPEDGFWADAKLLSEQLQAGPSRIDGPAKVYTLRGKYRQFFLRVTAENIDEFVSTNLVIKPDRILDVVVEALLPPGRLPLPPQIPRDLRRSPTPESSSLSPAPELETFYNVPQRFPEYTLQEFEDIRRHNSPSDRLSFRDTSPQNSLQTNHSPRESNDPRGNFRHRSITSMPESLRSIPSTRHRYKSPTSDEEPEDIRKLVVDAVDHIIQQDPEWTEFFRAMGAVQPHRAMDVLKQYRFVKRMIDQWVGTRAPFRSSEHIIEVSHITEALKINDPNFSSACTETLALLDLYGKNGQHYEDPRVVAMMNDTTRPEYNAKPIKRMLHLLRDIDKEWRKEHPRGSTSPGEIRSIGESH